MSNAHHERDRSPEEKITAHPGANQNVNKFHFTHSAIAIIALILASASLMGMCWALSNAHDAEIKAQVATMRVEGLTRALIAHGIKDTYPHVPGEDD